MYCEKTYQTDSQVRKVEVVDLTLRLTQKIVRTYFRVRTNISI